MIDWIVSTVASIDRKSCRVEQNLGVMYSEIDPFDLGLPGTVGVPMTGMLAGPVTTPDGAVRYPKSSFP